MAKSPKFNKKRSARSNKRSTKKVTTPSKAFTKKVQAIIHKDAETKESSTVMSLTAFNSGVNSSGDAIRIVPNISQGTGNGFRVGDVIQGQKLHLRGHMLITAVPNVGSQGINYPTSIPSNCRLMIRAFICSVKRYSNYDDVYSNATTWMPDFLKNGAATQGLDGTIQSMYLPVNTDVITVHKEIKRYVTIPFLTGVTTSGGPTVYPGLASIDVSTSCKFFSGDVKCKKQIKYDDTTLTPQNFAPVFVLSYCHLDGSSPDIISTAVSASFVSSLFYEDV